MPVTLWANIRRMYLTTRSFSFLLVSEVNPSSDGWFCNVFYFLFSAGIEVWALCYWCRFCFEDKCENDTYSATEASCLSEGSSASPLWFFSFRSLSLFSRSTSSDFGKVKESLLCWCVCFFCMKSQREMFLFIQHKTWFLSNLCGGNFVLITYKTAFVFFLGGLGEVLWLSSNLRFFTSD